eukprot:GHVT01087416.1.p1 GENE.GHVT01087416.1~~GHVT01087416.1.p1  ORF type:complete len:150 (+),score=3.04 GHVT01087416.1:1059-1508(+)
MALQCDRKSKSLELFSHLEVISQLIYLFPFTFCSKKGSPFHFPDLFTLPRDPRQFSMSFAFFASWPRTESNRFHVSSIVTRALIRPHQRPQLENRINLLVGVLLDKTRQSTEQPQNFHACDNYLCFILRGCCFSFFLAFKIVRYSKCVA